MRLLNVGAQLLTLTPLAVGVQSFPTADNLQKLAERFSASAEGDYGDLRDALINAKAKRLLFDPLTKPIDGRVTVSR